jgi:hypothetical protein
LLGIEGVSSEETDHVLDLADGCVEVLGCMGRWADLRRYRFL